MIALDYQPLSIVEDEGFRLYSKSLRPEYTLPSRKTLTESLVPEYYSTIQQKLVDMLDNVDILSLTTNLWSSESNKFFITITAHFIYDFKSYSVILATEEIKKAHTGENIAEAIRNILEKFRVTDKVITVVTDNAENMRKAISKDLNMHHHPCVAHTLNLCVQDAINSNVEFSAILSKCKKLVGYFKRNNNAAYKLKEIQEQMNLPVVCVVQDVATRWNSSLMMLERLLKLKLPLTVALASLTDAEERNLDADEWIIIEETIPVLKPALSMTEKLSGEQYPTMSLIVPLIRGLQKSLQKKSHYYSNCNTAEAYFDG
ncbi:E3 SUMO-protein ligase ZBED1-like [Homalodisca vitripennis]|uniref:E3 SUMO-protein ligase ZBED1-like n=1 Tax=Homalodisca vitripennis TaxID=197043 RepID=UPI001EECAB5E|nr:E3 SUMO-protein ligase ZBED1-like [Homalodisca vitripennis]